MSSAVPRIKLNNGLECPALGLGTWKGLPGEVTNGGLLKFAAVPGEVTQAVEIAIDAGYRHLDCARAYENEREVGAGIRNKIDEGVVAREEMFVTSKLWNTHHRRDLVVPALQRTLRDLGLDYVDLYLVHTPIAFQESEDLFPSKDGKTVYSDVDYVDTWKGMEDCVKLGLARSIGISNFNSEQIERVLAAAEIRPAMTQFECHPYMTQKKLIAFCKERGIAVTAYSPLGSPDRPWAKQDEVELLDDPNLKHLAEKHGKSPAQICIRYQIQRGNATIPMSVHEKHIRQDIDIFDFDLSPEDMALVDSLDRHERVCCCEGERDHKDWPFAIEF